MARLLWLYEASGVQRLVRRAHLLPKQLQAMEAILPPISPHYDAYRARRPHWANTAEMWLFSVGCIQEAFLSPG